MWSSIPLAIQLLRLLHNTITFNYLFIEVILLKEELWELFMINYVIKI
jgi:hypothetical protein